MKIILYIGLLLLTFSGFGQSVYYCQDTSENASASDANAGTNISLPWATWQYAIDNATTPGDTVYFRGGTWMLGAGEKVTIDPTGSLAGNGTHGDSGTIDNHIVFMNYPGEVPILDATNTTSYEEVFEMWGTSYVELIGLTFQNKKGTYPQDTAKIHRQVIIDSNGTIWLDRLTSRNSHGYGFTINNWDTLYLFNCDSYEHYDSIWYLGDGNKPDGFAVSSGGEATDYGYVKGCRAWRCSDDGFEFSWSPFMLIDSVWSFCNGYGSAGAGVGIKYGEGYIADSANRITQRCIVAHNKAWAYAFQNLYTAQNGPIGNFYNNLSYSNEGDFQSVISSYFTDCDAGDTYLNFRNNLCYGASNKYLNLVTCDYSMVNTKWFASNNTWTWHDNSYKYVVNDTVSWALTGKEDQWVSLPDSSTTLSALSAARQSDGSLPDIGNNFHLAGTSDLIDAGIDVGLAYEGSAPDIGPFEYPAIVIEVESIVVTGTGDATTIEEDDGTLQMLAAVLPEDASFQSVTWSVIPGTGTASINQSGVLLALTDGTVTVRGTAQDGTGIYGEVVITISNQDAFTLPTIITSITSSPHSVQAICGGNVTANGGAAVTARGVCWSTSENPTTADSHTVDGSGTGAFVSTLTNLNNSTLYYVRAYATNSEGTAYGDNRQVNTTAFSVLRGGGKAYRLNGKTLVY